MNTRTSLIAIGATLALIAPAAANARAIVSQQSDMYHTYFTSEHGSHALVNATNFVSENGNRIQIKNSTTNVVSENGHLVTSGKTQHTIRKTGTGGKRIVVSPGVAPNAYVDPNDCGDYGGTETCTNTAAAPQDA